MFINLTNFLETEASVHSEVIPFEKDVVSNGYEAYPIISKTDISLRFTNIRKGEIEITGNCEVICEIPCSRCLEAVNYPMKLTIHEVVKESEITSSDQNDEQPFINGYQLDADALIINEILINWPLKVLCREDCKGICKVCGKNLNEGDCGCDTFVPDPRMAVIKDIFNA